MNIKTYPIKTVDTYVYLVKENLLLIRDLIDKKNNKIQPFDPNNTEPYYQARAKHLQSMAFIGLTCEHLLKLIIQNRGYSINLVNNIKRIKNNKVKINYSDSLISFEALVSLFKNINIIIPKEKNIVKQIHIKRAFSVLFFITSPYNYIIINIKIIFNIKFKSIPNKT